MEDKEKRWHAGLMEEVRTASDVAAHTGRTKTGVEWAAGKEQIREAKASLFQSDFHMV